MNDDEFSYYVQQLHSPDGDHAYFALLTHTTPADFSRLVHAYRTETETRTRANLVTIISRHPSPEALEFLVHVLRETNGEIWKTALDGLVATKLPQAVKALEAEKERRISISSPDLESRLEWIDEAIGQLLRP